MSTPADTPTDPTAPAPDYSALEARLDEQFAMIEDLQNKLASIMVTGEGAINCAALNAASIYANGDIDGEKVNARVTFQSVALPAPSDS